MSMMQGVVTRNEYISELLKSKSLAYEDLNESIL